MSAEPISQREFDTYVKTTSEAIVAIQEQGRETLDVLKELIIVNDCPKQELIINHPQVKIFNFKKRFKTVGGKRNEVERLQRQKKLLSTLLGSSVVALMVFVVL